MKRNKKHDAGFIKIRRGIQDHLIEGKLSAFDLGIYALVHLQANFKTGVWVGSAARIFAVAPRGATLRKIQRALRRLADIGFIKPFRISKCSRGNYPTLIDKFEPQLGAHKGYRLNATKSEDWKHPHYEACALSGALSGALVSCSVSSIQEVRRGEGGRKTAAGDLKEKLLAQIREIVAGLPEVCRSDAAQFHHAVEASLNSLGWTVTREYEVNNRGDGTPGRIDLVVTAPHRIAIELDGLTPRQKSIAKLFQFDGIRVLVLREQTGAAAVRELREPDGHTNVSDLLPEEVEYWRERWKREARLREPDAKTAAVLSREQELV